jgi:uncharacterized protein YbaA (DUF1428 family)
MPYVDGFVIPVPNDKVEAYRERAARAGEVWRELGALEYRECIAEDVKPGELTSFPQAVKLEEGETVIFSWIVYASREARDAINAKVMSDPRLADMCDPGKQLFDAKRLIYGGFEVLVEV